MVGHARERPKLTAKGERHCRGPGPAGQSLGSGVVAVDQQRGCPGNLADL